MKKTFTQSRIYTHLNTGGYLCEDTLLGKLT